MTPTVQIPGIYHRKVGDIVVTAVSDGYLDGNLTVLRNVDLDLAHKVLADNFRPARRTSVNTFLIHSRGRMALIDAGCGDKMAATGGKLVANLATMGVTLDQIDTVLLTHLHPDHVGALTGADDVAVFPVAKIVLHQDEAQYWGDNRVFENAVEGVRNSFFKPARRVLTAYKERLNLFNNGEVFPGVMAVPSPGHTPGHSGFLISSGDEQLMIWGDTVHIPEVQTAFPQAGMSFDTDVEQAAASRARMFDRVAKEKMLVAGMHTHFPGFGRLVHVGAGFGFISEAWQHSL